MPGDRYRALLAHHEAERDRAHAESVRLATVRGITFVLAGAGWVVGSFAGGTTARWGLILGAALTAVFIAEVVIHARVKRRERWHETLVGLCEEGLLRLDRDWKGLDAALPARERRPIPLPRDHPFARDLSVQGHASLRRLLGPTTTEPGMRRLVGWLTGPAAPAEAMARSEAVRELSPRTEQRLTLAGLGRQAGRSDPDAMDRLLEWAEGRGAVDESGLLRARSLFVAGLVLPGLLILAVAADIWWAAPPLWLLPAIPQAWLLRHAHRRYASGFSAVGSMAPALRAYLPQLEELARWSGESALLGARLGEVAGEDGGAPELLARLRSLVDTVESRANMFYPVFAVILLLDLHLGLRLDRWRAAHGGRIRIWVAALGEVEALCSLAALAHDHPDWAFPVWGEGEGATVAGTGLGHPFLPDPTCVRNDVRIGPPGSFLLVTGSNMSGKSTLLRAIGANVVLAGAGGPVCADRFELAPVRVCTGMHVEDSLEDGVSLFMAQLLRVRQIVDIARADGGARGPVLFLLDEILHGTNSAERRIAAQAVVRHLLGSGAIGAVSTHDLALADAPDLAEPSDPVHFREAVIREGGGTRLEFDYRMRPGLAETSNALALLEAVGLPVD